MVVEVSYSVAFLLLTINHKVNNVLKRLRRVGFCAMVKAADVGAAAGTRGEPCICLFYDPNGALSFLLLLGVSSRFCGPYPPSNAFFLSSGT